MYYITWRINHIPFHQLKLYLKNDVVSNYLWINFNLTPDQVRDQIQTNIDKRNYGIDYYNKRKEVDGVKENKKSN